MKSNQIIVIALACLVTIALRFVQLPITNFGSMLALSLLCGFAIRRPWACLIPLAIRALTDIGLELKTGYGFYPNWYFDYVAYLFVALLGQRIANGTFLKKASTIVAIAALLTLVGFGGFWLLNSELTVDQLQTIRPVVQFSAAFLLCYAVTLSVGNDMLRKVFAATAGSIAIYYLISNFGAWMYAPESYDRSLSGLFHCYVMGVPFVRATVFGNLLLAPVFFAGWNRTTSSSAAVVVRETVLAEESSPA